MAVKLGNGNWAVKEDKLLAYNDNSGRFFNKEFDFARGSIATYVAKDGLIKSAASDVPRIDFSDSTKGALLLEGQSTNLVNYSQDFSDSSWVKSSSTITPNTSISPDGTLNGSKLTVTSTGALLESSQSLSAGTVYTISAFVKKGTNKFVRLAYSSSSQTGAWFNLEDKTVGTVNSTSATINDYGNGWYRITNTLTSQVSSGGVFLGLSNTDGATGDSVSGNTVYVYGFQIEQQSFATSYIPSLSGSATTRLADVCNNSGSAQDFNSEEGVLYAEIAALANDGTNRIISLSDGSYDNSVRIQYYLTANVIEFRIVTGGVIQALQRPVITNVLQFNKIAISYAENNFALWVNGVKVATDTSGNTPIGLSELSFDDGNGSNDFYGKTKNIQVFTEAKSDEFLAALTTI